MGTKILGIDIGSWEVKAVIAESDESGVKIIGIGTERSSGIKKGAISNIEEASRSIKNALASAQRIAGTKYDKVIVSISGANTKGISKSGMINIPNHEIGISEIERAMQTANHYANIPTDYEKIHVLPYSFKVDEQEHIEDPLGMSGATLEVQAHIIIAQKSILNNIKKAVNLAGLSIDNIVLSGYASAIATINKDERDLGVAVVDMGGSVSDVVVHNGNSIIFNDFLPVGSYNITNDMSLTLHTPIPNAEEIKVNFGSYAAKSGSSFETPLIGNSAETKPVSVDVCSNIIYARAEETLCYISNIINEMQKSNPKFKDIIGAGIVFTGGMSKLHNFQETAGMVFGDTQIRIAKPRALEGLYEVIRDPSNSCVIGLCLYGAGKFTPYELDSEKKMRYKGEPSSSFERVNLKNVFDGGVDSSNSQIKQAIDEKLGVNAESEKSELLDISYDNEEKKPNFFSRLWHKLTNMF